MAKITNNSDISLTLAVWAVDDNYDYEAGEGFDKPYISVTTLLKPLKQLIMTMRVPAAEREEDVEDFIARALGHTIHDGIEKAWKKNYAKNLRKLGFPEAAIEKIRINPTDEERAADPDMIPVFLEQRAYREFGGWVIGGKFDNVMEGHVEDTKSTSVWAYVLGDRTSEHRLQGSFYKWIDEAQDMPKITEDWMRVNFVFTDWQKAMARQQPDRYPQNRTHHKDLRLLTSDEVTDFVRTRFNELQMYGNKLEKDIPRCTPEDLWQSEPQYKYYSDASKVNDPAARSSKNFTDLVAANAHLAEKGKGAIKTVPGEVKRCPYCPAYDICEQRKEYFPDVV